jgi:hypothetical protein
MNTYFIYKDWKAGWMSSRITFPDKSMKKEIYNISDIMDIGSSIIRNPS